MKQAKIGGANSTEEYILRITEGAAIGSLAGLAGGKGSASKHTSNSFWRFVKKGNWRYYSSQAKNQAIADGFKAISGIVRSNLPSASKTFFKTAIQWETR